MADINPLVGIFDEFSKILNQMVIKYSGKAESEETYTSKSHADKYMAAYMNRDSYDTYIGSYTKDDFKEIGIQDPDIIDIYVKDNSLIPDAYHRKLFKIHHDSFLGTYEDYNKNYFDNTKSKINIHKIISFLYMNVCKNIFLTIRKIHIFHLYMIFT